MRGGVVAFVLCTVTAARADDAITTSAVPDDPSKNLFYAEVGGKAGLYGVGYERTLTSRL